MPIQGIATRPRRARAAAVFVAVALVLIVAAGYLATATLVYDRLSTVDAACGGRFAANTPAAWSLGGSGSSGGTALEPSSLFVRDFETVRFGSRDPGIELHGWWLPSSTGPSAPAVIVVHGRGSCVREPNVLAPAGMLARAGYAVLLLDLRDHGASTIEDGRYAGGTEEYLDVLAAVDWLESIGVETDQVGAFGVSMGAATVIIAAGQDRRITAVWEDSGYADIERRIAEELEQEGLPRILAPASALAARVVSGDDLTSYTVLGEMANLSGRHLFIAHGTRDEATYVSHAADLAASAWLHGVVTDVWAVSDAGHAEAMFLRPADYERRLRAFFDRAFSEPARPPARAGAWS